jgi:hypothetical protein
VERLGPTPISCAHTRAVSHKLLGNTCVVSRSRDVQRRITSVDKAGDRLEVVRHLDRSGGAGVERLACECG